MQMLAALKANGIHTKRGYNLVEDCANVLIKMVNYDQSKQAINAHGWILGTQLDVDEVMNEVTCTVSLWRRQGFMNNGNYEFASEFEEFVNWARWFLIRGVPYSGMAWHHDSTEVRGMGAFALVRALPRLRAFQSESASAVVRPNITWQRFDQEDWVIGDLIDGSLVGEIRLNSIL